MKTLRLTVDSAESRPSEAIAAAAQAAPLLIVTGRALADLADELGGYDRAACRLLSIAEDIARPIGANLPTGPDTSQTIFLAPRSWSRARLAGWVAGHHELLEQQFGPSTLKLPEDLTP